MLPWQRGRHCRLRRELPRLWLAVGFVCYLVACPNLQLPTATACTAFTAVTVATTVTAPNAVLGVDLDRDNAMDVVSCEDNGDI